MPGPQRASVTINQTVQNIQNVSNIHVNAIGQTQHFSLASPPVFSGLQREAKALPGWPERWAPPSVTPMPFSPPGFEVSLDQLTSAADALPPSVREACKRGDPAAVVQLLMGILRQVHADPKERNVYVNPRRGDQALVYIPEHWITCPLDEAGQTMFRRIAERLGCLPQTAPPAVRTMATAARQSCEREVSGLSRASRAALAAHLENMRHGGASGVDWLGTGTDERESLAFFGQEWTGHLTPALLVAAAEAAAGVYVPEQVTEATGPVMTARALVECARYLVHGHSGNLIVIPAAEEERVYMHERPGWTLRSREDASSLIIRRIATIMDDQLDGAGATPLLALRPWLRDRVGELQGGEFASQIVQNYLAAARYYYGGLAPKPDPRDRREAARRLMASPPELAWVAEAGGEAVGPAGAPPLAESDLADILGFAL